MPEESIQMCQKNISERTETLAYIHAPVEGRSYITWRSDGLTQKREVRDKPEVTVSKVGKTISLKKEVPLAFMQSDTGVLD